MNLLNHNGLDVRTQEEVDEAHRIVCAQAEQWHLKKISKPHLQHGTYSFSRKRLHSRASLRSSARSASNVSRRA